MNDVATLSNLPADPAVLFSEEVEDLLLEARNHLDGNPIENEAQAEAVSAILNRARRIAKDADEARKIEAKPFDEGKAAVQTKWRPITDSANLAADTAKQALAPWLQAIEAENERQRAFLAAEALRLTQVALEAHKGSAGDLQAAEDAERLMKAAVATTKDATKAGKAKAHAKGGERAVGLRSVFTPTLTSACEALKHYREHQPEALKIWLVEQAEKDVRAGARSIPGFTIEEDRVAV